MEGKDTCRDGIDSKLFFQEIKKHKAIVAGIILCCTMLAILCTFMKPVEYRSEAVICLKNPGIVRMEENLQSIMLWKNEAELSGVELDFVKESSSIRVSANRKNGHEAYEAVNDAVECIQQAVNKKNQAKKKEEYPSLKLAEEEMDIAKHHFEEVKKNYSESSEDFKKAQDEYKSRAKVYENLLNERVRTVYAVQTIKSPSVPEKPEKIKRGNTILIGFLIGCLISFFYCMRQYKRRG